MPCIVGPEGSLNDVVTQFDNQPGLFCNWYELTRGDVAHCLGMPADQGLSAYNSIVLIKHRLKVQADLVFLYSKMQHAFNLEMSFNARRHFIIKKKDIVPAFLLDFVHSDISFLNKVISILDAGIDQAYSDTGTDIEMMTLDTISVFQRLHDLS